MKLQRLAGFGPIAAFVTAGCLLVYATIDQFAGQIVSAVPGGIQTLEDAYLIALPLWALALAVLVFGLDRMGSSISRGATLVAFVVTLVIDVGLVLKAGALLQAPAYFLIYCGVGIALLALNVGGRRTGLVHGVMRWLGAASGTAYIIAGIGFGLFLVPGIGGVAYMVGFNVKTLGMVVYVIWAIWMGVHLSRSNAQARAVAAASAAS